MQELAQLRKALRAAEDDLAGLHRFLKAPVPKGGSRTIKGSLLAGTGTDLTLVWKRRARSNAEWVSYIDVPLDEISELYDVDVMNGATVMRTFASLTSPTATYTAAQQSSDWGTVPSTFTVNVYQISNRYGRGKAGVAVV